MAHVVLPFGPWVTADNGRSPDKDGNAGVSPLVYYSQWGARISLDPPGNTGQKKVTSTLQEGSVYDKRTLSYS